MMYNVQIGPKSDDIQPIAETLFVSLIKTEDNVENAEAETCLLYTSGQHGFLYRIRDSRRFRRIPE